MIGLVKIRKLKSDDKGSLRGDTLESAVREDKAKGLVPFFVSIRLQFITGQKKNQGLWYTFEMTFGMCPV